MKAGQHHFTDRAGGVSAGPWRGLNLGDHVGDDPQAVRENRRRLAASIDRPDDQLVWMGQVHGAAVAVLDGPRPSGVPGVDALVTDVPGLALAVLVADCVPVLLADASAGVVGAAHAGRVGLAAGVVLETVGAMIRLGADPRRIQAYVGPSVCGRCYEVPAELRDEVAARVPGTSASTSHGTPSLDLPAGVLAQLRGCGVQDVELSPRCTMQDPSLYSFRRDGVTGRQAGLVWVEPQ